MLILLLLLWLAVYICSIFTAVIKLREVNGALQVLSKYIDSADVTGSGYIVSGSGLLKKDNYEKCLSNALTKFPIICKYSDYYTWALEYGASDMQNYLTAIKLYNQLAMKSNYVMEELKSALNPIQSLKTLISLPGTVLSWVGISHKKSFSTVLNILCWIAVYLLGLYSDEIKELINLILKNLINA